MLSRTRAPESFSRIAAIMEAHRDEWKRGYRAELRRGFIDKLSLDPDELQDVARLPALLSTIPFARTLNLLFDERSPVAVIMRALEEAAPEHLRQLANLSLCGTVRGTGALPFPDVSGLIKALPLTDLSVLQLAPRSAVFESDTIETLFLGGTSMPRLRMPSLTSASCLGGDSAQLYASIAGGDVPALRSVRHHRTAPHLDALENPELHRQLVSVGFRVVDEPSLPRLRALAQGTSLLIQIDQSTHQAYEALRDLPNVKIPAPEGWHDDEDDYEDGWE